MSERSLYTHVHGVCVHVENQNEVLCREDPQCVLFVNPGLSPLTIHDPQMRDHSLSLKNTDQNPRF